MNTTAKIDKEFRSLIPPLSPEELAQLEENISRDKCRDPLVVWKEQGILLDGHNRMEICNRLGIGYRVVEIELSSRDEAAAWIIRNQFGRRNLSDYIRAKLALQLEPLVSSIAKSRQLKTQFGGKTAFLANPAVVQNSAPPCASKTRDEVSVVAGVSHDTVSKVKKIESDGDESIKEMAASGEVSIHAASAVATLPKAQQKKVAAEGPKAVREKAKEIREEKSTPPSPPPDPAKPWAEFESGIRGVVSELRTAAIHLRAALEYDPDTKRNTAKWAHFFSTSSSIDAINALIRRLEDSLPACVDAKAPGYISFELAKARKINLS